jgi:hypothetical protein
VLGLTCGDVLVERLIVRLNNPTREIKAEFVYDVTGQLAENAVAGALGGNRVLRDYVCDETFGAKRQKSSRARFASILVNFTFNRGVALWMEERPPFTAIRVVIYFFVYYKLAR